MEELPYLFSQQDALLKSVSPFTIQLFYIEALEIGFKVDPIATGVLLKFEDDRYLITCNHVFNGVFTIDTVSVATNTNYTQLYGKHRFYRDFDLRIIQLERDSVSIIEERHQFLDLSGTDILSNDLPATGYFSVVGFPFRRTIINSYKTEISQKFYMLSGQADELENYNTKLYPFDSKCYIMLKIDQKRMTSAKSKLVEILPKLQGMSGCGIWRLYTIDGKTVGVSLSGILCQESSDRKKLVGLRIQVVTEFLRLKYNQKIPNSALLNFTITSP